MIRYEEKTVIAGTESATHQARSSGAAISAATCRSFSRPCAQVAARKFRRQRPTKTRPDAQRRTPLSGTGAGRRRAVLLAALTREILTAAIGRGLGDADFAAPIESGRHEALANPAFRSNTTTSW